MFQFPDSASLGQSVSKFQNGFLADVHSPGHRFSSAIYLNVLSWRIPLLEILAGKFPKGADCRSKRTKTNSTDVRL